MRAAGEGLKFQDRVNQYQAQAEAQAGAANTGKKADEAEGSLLKSEALESMATIFRAHFNQYGDLVTVEVTPSGVNIAISASAVTRAIAKEITAGSTKLTLPTLQYTQLNMIGCFNLAQLLGIDMPPDLQRLKSIAADPNLEERLRQAGAKTEQAEEAIAQAMSKEERAEAALAHAERLNRDAEAAKVEAEAKTEQAKEALADANQITLQAEAKAADAVTKTKQAEEMLAQADSKTSHAEAKMAEAVRKAERAKEELAQAESKTRQAEAKMADAETNTKQAKDALARADQITNQAEAKMAETVRKTEQAKEELAQAESKTRQAEVKMAEAERKAEQVKEELAQVHSKTIHVEANIAEAAAKTEQAEKALAEADGKNTLAEEKLSAAELKAKHAEEMMAQAEKSAEQSDETLVQANNKTQLAEAARAEAESKVARLNEAFAQAEAKARELEARLRQATEQVQRAEATSAPAQVPTSVDMALVEQAALEKLSLLMRHSYSYLTIPELKRKYIDPAFIAEMFIFAFEHDYIIGRVPEFFVDAFNFCKRHNVGFPQLLRFLKAVINNKSDFSWLFPHFNYSLVEFLEGRDGMVRDDRARVFDAILSDVKTLQNLFSQPINNEGLVWKNFLKLAQEANGDPRLLHFLREQTTADGLKLITPYRLTELLKIFKPENRATVVDYFFECMKVENKYKRTLASSREELLQFAGLLILVEDRVRLLKQLDDYPLAFNHQQSHLAEGSRQSFTRNKLAEFDPTQESGVRPITDKETLDRHEKQLSALFDVAFERNDRAYREAHHRVYWRP